MTAPRIKVSHSIFLLALRLKKNITAKTFGLLINDSIKRLLIHNNVNFNDQLLESSFINNEHLVICHYSAV